MQKLPTQSCERVKGRRPLRSPEAAPLASPPSQPPRIRADCAEQIDTEPHHHQRNVEDRRAPALRLQGENRHIHPRQHIQQVAVAELEAAQRLVADDNRQVHPDHQRQPNQPERIPAAAANQRIEIHAQERHQHGRNQVERHAVIRIKRQRLTSPLIFRQTHQLLQMLHAWKEQADKLSASEIGKDDYDRWRYYYPKYDTTQLWAKVPSQELSDTLVEAFQDKLKKDK